MDAKNQNEEFLHPSISDATFLQGLSYDDFVSLEDQADGKFKKNLNAERNSCKNGAHIYVSAENERHIKRIVDEPETKKSHKG